ncbi:hypothetical protein FSU_0037 [Fibrobacter succinogenes subsp. succinogenes S85]|uniref:Uncharacterized protein n=1 Tax=Fibrobacter succinogenes (strain ATCC 19169 / S85) TaxID=59374 RepID=D9S4B4_FIBSS|nr:hypothetical protein FSU_0037 [Fibrobacter succinogenes subsp. succinogenes S85]
MLNTTSKKKQASDKIANKLYKADRIQAVCFCILFKEKI